MIDTTHYASPLGDILLAGRGEGLIGLWIEGQKYFLGSQTGEVIERETPILAQTKAWLDRYFSGGRPAISELTLAPDGSEFRQAVWEILRRIPYGETTTYGAIASELAARTGRTKLSAQAVGGAVGHNPISIIVPCHRVVGAGGSLTGYAGGIDKKIWLLAHEGVDLARFFTPKKGTAL